MTVSSARGRATTRSRLALGPLAAPVLTTGLAVALALSVDLAAGTGTNRFLLWNLFLAWVPLPLALLALRGHRRGVSLAALSPLLAVWLVFLPNAPYIVTDLVHLGRLPAVPAPLEMGVLLAAGLAGLLVGFASLALVERIIADRAGRAWGRAFVVAALVLSSFGVYLGRVLRWNSWDVVASPGPLLADIVERITHPVAHPVTWSSTVVFSLFLVTAYAALLALARRVDQELPRG